MLFFFLLIFVTSSYANFPLSSYIKTPLSVPSLQGSSISLDIYIPTIGSKETRLTTPQDVYKSVSLAYETIVEPQQAGLVDAKHSHLMQAPLHPEEAWHHYRAGKNGIVDSARFLITFSMIPSIQAGGSRLHICAALGLIDEMRKLLFIDTISPDLEKEDDGLTPLHFATAMRQVEAVKLLIESGANIEKVGLNGATSLMIASAFGFDDIVKELLHGGANVRAIHPFASSTALHFAAEMGRVETEILLCRFSLNYTNYYFKEHKDVTRGEEEEEIVSTTPLGRLQTRTGGTPLHTAADTNQSGIIKTLVNECGSLTTDLLNGDTQPLYMAAQRGFTDVVRELVTVGADINFVMPTGHFSGALIDLKMRQHISNFDDGSDPLVPTEPGAFYSEKNTKLGNGATALHAAVENNHPHTVYCMVNEFDAKQLTSMEGASPLLIALQYKHPDIALILLNSKLKDANVNSQIPRDGQFALYVAALEGYEAVVKEILNQNGNPSLVTRSGHSALSASIERGFYTITNLLLNAGANVDTSAMIAAINKKNIYILKSLVLHQVKNKQYDTDKEKEEEEEVHKVNKKLKHISSKKRKQELSNISPSPLHSACLKGWTEGINLLLLSSHLFGTVESRVQATNATCLLLAASGGHENAVKILLEKYDANPNVIASKAMYSATPLLAASQKGSTKIVSALLEAGADPTARMRGTDASSLYVASERGHCDIVSILLSTKKGKETIGWRVKGGATALQAAALSGFETCIVKLINAGAMIDSIDDTGYSALFNCAKSDTCTSSSLNLLIGMNASLVGTNTSLLSLVIKSKRNLRLKLNIIKLLRSKGAIVYADAILTAIHVKSINNEVDVPLRILSSLLSQSDTSPMENDNILSLGLCAAAEVGGTIGATLTDLILDTTTTLIKKSNDYKTIKSRPVCSGKRTPEEVARDARESDVLKRLVEEKKNTDSSRIEEY